MQYLIAFVLVCWIMSHLIYGYIKGNKKHSLYGAAWLTSCLVIAFSIKGGLL